MFIASRSAHVIKLVSLFSLGLSQKSYPARLPCPRLAHIARALPNLKPLNAKITEYMKGGFVDDAQKLFDEMPLRNTVTWNALIRGYFQNGQFDNGFNLFDRMPERDIFSYNTMIAGLMQCGDVSGATEVFLQMPFRDVVTWNSMISGYMRIGLLDKAVQFFNEMPVKDVVSWNLVIGGLVDAREFGLAEELFEEMTFRDVASWTIMISARANAGRISEARELFENMPTRDTQAWNKMIAGYVANGHVEIAECLFQKMPEHDFDSCDELLNGMVSCGRINDAIKLYLEIPYKCQRAWNSVIMGLIKNGLCKEAHAFLVKTAFSDIISWTNMIVGYFEIGEVGSAVELFESMSARDTTVWNATIFGLGQNDQGEEGVKFFIRMIGGGPSPDEATYTSILTIFSDLPALLLGIQAHAQIIRTGFDCFIAVSNAMVTMYARCGNMDSALLEFSSMPSHDVISWNSIICGFAHHGNGEKALEMFEHMRLTGVKPNQITFVGVLSACSHAGLVDQGKYYFNIMKYECFLEPSSEHYTCIVDLLGRFGLINEATSILDQMRAKGAEVPASVWGAVLQACRMHKNIEMGEIAGEKVLEIEPYNTGIYMILAEMYLASGRRECAAKIWVRMKEKGVKKQPGCSWIEVNNHGHVFLAGDSSHPEFYQSRSILNLLHLEIGIEIGVCKSNSA